MPSKKQRQDAQTGARSRSTLLTLLLVGAVLAVGAGIAYYATRTPAALDGEIAPEYRFTDLEGRTYALSELRGKPVIITTMAAWCVSCAQEHAELRRIHDEYNGGRHDEPRVFILSIDMDPQDTPQALREFQARYGGNWSFAMDTDDAARKFDIRLLDTTIVLDPEGRVVYHDTRPTTYQQFKNALEGAF